MEKQRCPYCLNLSDQNICPYCGEEREIAAAENTRAHARNIGNILAGRYQIGKALSHNGEGITYLAYDNQENTRVEIREYFPGNLCARQPDGSVLVGDETLLAFKSLMFDFTDMYKAVAEAGSPGLQKVREIFLEQGTAYAVCELYDLPTLAQYVRENGALSVMEAKRIMLELCSALTPIHRGGLIHGGISPRNILVDEESRIRITGFSTLSLRTRGSGIECELYPGFSAPEQYEANRWQGSWTDVYGIGAVAYHMLTGRYLPPAGERQTGAPLPGLRELPGLPGNMAATIEKALCPESERRIQSIEEFSAGYPAVPAGEYLGLFHQGQRNADPGRTDPCAGQGSAVRFGKDHGSAGETQDLLQEEARPELVPEETGPGSADFPGGLRRRGSGGQRADRHPHSSAVLLQAAGHRLPGAALCAVSGGSLCGYHHHQQ